jgi:membrane associated rhomboid family serine protease
MPAMGIYDRDYYRQSVPRGGFGHFVAWSVTTWLIVINVAVFFADVALQRILTPAETVSAEDEPEYAPEQPRKLVDKPLSEWGSLSIMKGIYRGQVWRFLTFQFLHSDPWHLLINMVALYFFCPIVETHFGPRRCLAFYLLCGLAGAVCFVMMAFTHVLNVHDNTQLVGASAGVFGLLVAAAMIAPHVEVFYYIFPVTILMLAVVGMLMAAYSVLAMGYNAAGEAAHLGGGVLGFALMKFQHWLTPFAGSARRAPVRRRRARVGQKDWSKDLNR